MVCHSLLLLRHVLFFVRLHARTFHSRSRNPSPISTSPYPPLKVGEVFLVAGMVACHS